MILKWIKKLLGIETIPDNIWDNNPIILDVRTPGEFKSGHVAHSVNIPLDELENSIKKFQSEKRPVVTCCASGRRSGIAADFLRRHKISAWNGGPWQSVRSAIVARR